MLAKLLKSPILLTFCRDVQPVKNAAQNLYKLFMQKNGKSCLFGRFFRTLLQFQVESYILEEICFLISAYSGDRRFFDALYGVVEADYPTARRRFPLRSIKDDNNAKDDLRSRDIACDVRLFLGCDHLRRRRRRRFRFSFRRQDSQRLYKHGGSAKYKVEDGAIVGKCVPNTPHNTFLVYEKPFGNFILKLDFKVDVPGNSGVQFRSAIREEGDRVFGYQCEIAPGDQVTCRIYDEGRRGHQKGRIWLDNTADDVLKASIATYKADDWNSIEIQAIGPSIRTWLNGQPVANFFDYKDFSGIIGLQIHSGGQGTIRWKNIRIKDLGVSEWHSFFVKGDDGWDLDGAYKFVPECWSFTEDGVLIGQHDDTEPRDCIVSNDSYDDFAAKVDYVFKGSVNSALYFRAHEVDTRGSSADAKTKSPATVKKPRFGTPPVRTSPVAAGSAPTTSSSKRFATRAKTIERNRRRRLRRPRYHLPERLPRRRSRRPED